MHKQDENLFQSFKDNVKLKEIINLVSSQNESEFNVSGKHIKDIDDFLNEWKGFEYNFNNKQLNDLLDGFKKSLINYKEYIDANTSISDFGFLEVKKTLNISNNAVYQKTIKTIYNLATKVNDKRNKIITKANELLNGSCIESCKISYFKFCYTHWKTSLSIILFFISLIYSAFQLGWAASNNDYIRNFVGLDSVKSLKEQIIKLTEENKQSSLSLSEQNAKINALSKQNSKLESNNISQNHTIGNSKKQLLISHEREEKLIFLIRNIIEYSKIKEYDTNGVIKFGDFSEEYKKPKIQDNVKTTKAYELRLLIIALSNELGLKDISLF